MDPEAAQVVIRSGIPISLTGLNVTRKTHFTKDWYDKIVAVDTPLTRLIKERMDPIMPRIQLERAKCTTN